MSLTEAKVLRKIKDGTISYRTLCKARKMGMDIDQGLFDTKKQEHLNAYKKRAENKEKGVGEELSKRARGLKILEDLGINPIVGERPSMKKNKKKEEKNVRHQKN